MRLKSGLAKSASQGDVDPRVLAPQSSDNTPPARFQCRVDFGSRRLQLAAAALDTRIIDDFPREVRERGVCGRNLAQQRCVGRMQVCSGVLIEASETGK